MSWSTMRVQRTSHERASLICMDVTGVMACPAMKTKDGLELQIGTNHFGHFLLTSLLYPLMQKHKE